MRNRARERQAVIWIATLMLLLPDVALAAPPEYAIGSVPPLSMPRGGSSAIKIFARKTGCIPHFRVVVTPQPAGLVSVDQSTAIVKFSLAPLDRGPFMTSFTASCGTGGQDKDEKQDVELRTHAAPEHDIISYERPLPDPASSAYATYEVKGNRGEKSFNGSMRQTQDVNLAGKVVLLDAATAKNPFWDILNGREDIENVRIYAESVFINDRLDLPGANVTIHARTLCFGDNGSISTTPQSRREQSTEQKAEDGQKAGDVVLHIAEYQPAHCPRLLKGQPIARATETVRTGLLSLLDRNLDALAPADASVTRTLDVIEVSEDAKLSALTASNFSSMMVVASTATPGQVPTKTRFYLKGGSGQPAKPSIKGLPGRSVKPITDVRQLHHPCRHNISKIPDDTIFIWEQLCTLRAGGLSFAVTDQTIGDSEYPGDGGSGTIAGKPGDGGAGGSLKSTINAGIHQSADMAGGEPGTPGGAAEGGDPGTPRTAKRWQLRNIAGNVDFKPWVHGGSRTSIRPDPIPPPVGKVGSSGVFSPIPAGDEPLSWLHPVALDMITLHLRDAYLNGRLDYVSHVAADYHDLLERLPDHRMSAFAATKFDINTMLSRAADDRDYFGHKPGWTPYLSLRTNYLSFEQEIGHSVRMIYLTEWFAARWRKDDNLTQGLKQMAANARDSAASRAIEITSARQQIDVVRQQAALIARDMLATYQALQRREKDLSQQATAMVEARHRGPGGWQAALKTLGVIATIVPVGQPAVGAVGVALNTLAAIDPGQDPMATIDAAARVYTAANDVDLATFGREIDQQLSIFDPDKSASSAEYISKLSNFTRTASQTVEKLRAITGERRVPATEVQAELERLKVSDPDFQDLIAQVRDLVNKKEQFAAQLTDLLDRLPALLSEMSRAVSLADTSARDTASILASQDLALRAQMKQLSRQALDRLVSAHYYLAKAYEYETGNSYQGSMNLDRFMTALLGQVSPKNAPPILPENGEKPLVTALRENLQQLATTIINERRQRVQGKVMQAVIPIPPEKLADLDQVGGQVVVNPWLLGYLPYDESGYWTANLSIKNVELEIAHNATATAVVFYVDHGATSIIRRSGRTLLFRHNDSGEPIRVWAFKRQLTGACKSSAAWIQAPAQCGVTPYIESTVERRTLAGLIKDIYPGQQPDELFAEFRPSAWGDFFIRMRTEPSFSTGVKVKALDLEISIDRRLDGQHDAVLDVRNERGDTVILSKTDKAGRADGRGAFVRFFNKGDEVELTTPAPFEGETFDRWSVVPSAACDGSGTDCRNTTLRLKLDDSMVVKPVYRNKR